jgi:hypothetical protein
MTAAYRISTADEPRRCLEAMNSALCHAPYAGLRQVECHLIEGQVVLTGCVPSYFLKQMAQSVLLKLCGLEMPFDNRIQVEYADSTD